MFRCHHCGIDHLECEAVDVSHIVAIARGHLACRQCAEEIETADAEDLTRLDGERRALEARCWGGVSGTGLRLFGELFAEEKGDQ